jgi:hypothetical protein
MKVEIILVPVGPIPQQATPPPLSQSCERLWHYTTRQKLEQILATGVIQPSTAFIEPAEKPVVWFSSRPTWEPTATKCPLTGKLGQYVTASAQGGLARIAVVPSSAPYRFAQLPLVAGTSPATCIGLVMAGLEVGADPDQWFFTPQAVPRAMWQAIEVYDFDADRWDPWPACAPGVPTASPNSASVPAQAPAQNTPLPFSPTPQKSVLDILSQASPTGRPDISRPSLN